MLDGQQDIPDTLRLTPAESRRIKIHTEIQRASEAATGGGRAKHSAVSAAVAALLDGFDADEPEPIEWAGPPLPDAAVIQWAFGRARDSVRRDGGGRRQWATRMCYFVRERFIEARADGELSPAPADPMRMNTRERIAYEKKQQRAERAARIALMLDEKEDDDGGY